MDLEAGDTITLTLPGFAGSSGRYLCAASDFMGLIVADGVPNCTVSSAAWSLETLTVRLAGQIAANTPFSFQLLHGNTTGEPRSLTRNLKPETRNPELGTRNPKPKTRNPKPKKTRSEALIPQMHISKPGRTKLPADGVEANQTTLLISTDAFWGAVTDTPVLQTQPVRPTPCTLHPTPYTHHPTPNTLHPKPKTRNPKPLTLNPRP